MFKSCGCLCVHSVFVTSFALVSIVSWLRDFCLVVDVMVSELSYIYRYLLRSRSVFISCRFSLYYNLDFGLVYREPTVIVLYDTPAQLYWLSLSVPSIWRAGARAMIWGRFSVVVCACVVSACMCNVYVFLPLVGVYHRPCFLWSIFLESLFMSLRFSFLQTVLRPFGHTVRYIFFLLINGN